MADEELPGGKGSNKWYGWKPDTPDIRDRRFAVRPMRAANLPALMDLSEFMGPVYDQGELGSCTGQAIAGALEYHHRKRGIMDFAPSRLFIYYEERVMEDTVKEDAGAMIRDGIKIVSKIGAPDEEYWPYIISRFTQKPPQEAYENALQNLIDVYRRVDNRDLLAIKTPLALGFPVVFGFTVYSEFEGEHVAGSGVLQMPREDEVSLGGHAVLAVGYNDETQRLLVRNSWGPEWGSRGYFTIPYDYVTNTDLADDFWAIEVA